MNFRRNICNMKMRFLAATFLAAAMVFFSLLAGLPCVLAQSSAPAGKSESIVVTGCLVKRDAPGTFALTTANGKLFYVSSSNVDLSKHSGHTVTITGVDDRQADPKHDPNNSSEADEIVATKVEMVSKTCR
jgi:hypothetical protein